MLASPQDWLVLLAVGFVMFGSKKLPEMAKSLGASIIEFKKAMNNVSEHVENAETAQAQPAPNATETSAAQPQAQPQSAPQAASGTTKKD